MGKKYKTPKIERIFLGRTTIQEIEVIKQREYTVTDAIKLRFLVHGKHVQEKLLLQAQYSGCNI